ncbi:MAG: serine/threonine-protein kinase [Myxococcota bacterium]
MSTSKESENLSFYSIRTMDVDIDILGQIEESQSENTLLDATQAGIDGEMCISEAFSTPQDFFSPIQRFKQKSLLGSGAYGEVWLAQDQMVQRPVAVKQLINKDIVVLENVKNEAALGARVAHPGTPTIYDIGLDDDGQFRVIMEYMEGESLDKVINRLKEGDPKTHAEYPFHVRAEMVSQVLRVLVAAHKKSIVHCDIKPANILVGLSKEVYLCDWGIAYDLNQSLRTRIKGTPNFMAPEQMTLNDFDERADLFGVAALAFQFLSLYDWHPYSNDIKTYMTEKLSHKPKLIDSVFHHAQGYVPSEYKAWVHKGLSLEPNLRHQSAVEMLKELEDIQNGIFCVVCPRTMIKHWSYRYLKALDRRPTTVMSLTVATLFASVIGIFSLGLFLS